ncbi:hypothetical protein PX699_20585 [Sphingobium sp. H39-3-25]|uniref:hypothetical protein n=1 Tax=Sphingobium arseniciresistens TaxID=3030834 RepID=UPI0023B9FE8D|nr:hypothetical protein [Sphingobium arseniciresistens]
MFKSAAIVAIAAVMTTVASPAFAKPEGRFGSAKITYNEKTNKYCLRTAQPSSLIPSVTCRTADAWADAGLTITRKASTQLAQR